MKCGFNQWLLLVVVFLFFYGCSTKQSRLQDAVEKGDTDTVRALLAQGAEVNAKGKNGFTPLILAAQNGHTDTVRVLLDAGADVNAKNEEGTTALITAAKNGHTDAMNVLLAAGAREPDFAVVRVFYATDRNRTGEKDPSSFFGDDRGKLELGTVEVSIPRDHRMGELEDPVSYRFEFRKNPSKHVVLLSVNLEPADLFFSKLSLQVRQSNRKEAFVFIHGYDTTFEDAARRTAQIAYDLGFDGAPILYSWPSKGTFSDYLADYENAQWTVPDLKTFLSDIVSKSGAQTIHLIAHSLGNLALTEALKNLAPTLQAQIPSFHFNQVVLAAPDIDTEIFGGLVKAFQQTAERITLYASSRDEALIISKKLRSAYPRAGDSSSMIVILPGIDTIDATAVDTGLIGHAYVEDNRSILSDIFSLFKDGEPPDKRFGLKPAEFNGLKYWLFKP